MSAPDPVLEGALRPLAKYFIEPKVAEVRMCNTEQIIIEHDDRSIKTIIDPLLTVGCLENVCTGLSNYYGLDFNPDTKPNLSCVLPEVGHRFECLVGASVQSNISLAIRLKRPFNADYTDFGLSKDVYDLITDKVLAGKNIIISGGTFTGKTTFLNMLLQNLPKETRIVAAEDAPEIILDKFYPDSVGIIAARNTHIPGMISWSSVTDHLNRITPDRVIYGEISVHNAMSALATLNSGINGFMCTIHAADPLMAIKYKFSQNLDMAGTPMLQIVEYLTQMVDLVIQLDRFDGKRKVSAVYDVQKQEFLHQV